MVKKLKERVNDKLTNPKVVRSKTATVVMSLPKVSRPSEVGQGGVQCTADGERESGATDVDGRSEFAGFKSKEEQEDLG